MTHLRWLRALWIWSGPLVIVFHVATSRADLPWLRAAGLVAAVLYVLAFSGLAYLRCTGCGAPFFGRFAGPIWGPWATFRHRPDCSNCGASWSD